jgi:hypothetical protein
MASLRPVAPVRLEALPESLVWNKTNIEAAKALVAPSNLPQHAMTDEQANLWFEVEARRLLRSKRAEVLKLMNVRPHGVSGLEFLAAHGLTWSDKDKARHLTL